MRTSSSTLATRGQGVVLFVCMFVCVSVYVCVLCACLFVSICLLAPVCAHTYLCACVSVTDCGRACVSVFVCDCVRYERKEACKTPVTQVHLFFFPPSLPSPPPPPLCLPLATDNESIFTAVHKRSATTMLKENKLDFV